MLRAAFVRLATMSGSVELSVREERLRLPACGRPTRSHKALPRKVSTSSFNGQIGMARPKGFEPLTPRFVVWCSIQLSYGRLTRRRGLGPPV